MTSQYSSRPGIPGLAVALCFLMAGAACWGASPSPAFKSWIDSEYPTLEQLYRHLHQHPELSFHEEKTAARLADELRKIGTEVTTKVGGHGFVAVLRNGPGRTVLFRTDLDALPVVEQTGVPYASRVRTTNDAGIDVGVMHACGHDIHMTSLIGSARLLAKFRENWKGTIVFIGQPAEERGSGARAMLKDGLFTRFPKPDFCLALHVNSELPAGFVTAVEGYTLANVDAVNILIRGVGGHGAWPHKTRDPIVVAAQTVLALQTIVSRETDPIDSAVVTVGSIHGGTKHNIIPEDVKLQLTVRSFTDETRQRTLESIRRIARSQALSAGVPEDRLPTVELEDESISATYNEPELARRLNGVFRNLVGPEKVPVRKPGMGGEDFSEYGRTAEKIPSCIFWLGAAEPERVAESERTGKPLPSLHSPLFKPVPEPTLKTGIAATTAAILELLRQP